MSRGVRYVLVSKRRAGAHAAAAACATLRSPIEERSARRRRLVSLATTWTTLALVTHPAYRCAKAESGLRDAQAQIKEKTKTLAQLQVGVRCHVGKQCERFMGLEDYVSGTGDHVCMSLSSCLTRQMNGFATAGGVQPVAAAQSINQSQPPGRYIPVA